MVKFKHFRLFNSFGELSSSGGVTLAFDELSPGVISIGVARCSRFDNFSRRTGRNISHGRLEVKPIDVMIDEEFDLKTVLTDIAHEAWELADFKNSSCDILEVVAKSRRHINK